jgi:hypothetical protein
VVVRVLAPGVGQRVFARGRDVLAGHEAQLLEQRHLLCVGLARPGRDFDRPVVLGQAHMPALREVVVGGRGEVVAVRKAGLFVAAGG